MNRAEWLEERKNHLGASEIAAVLGVDSRRGPLAVYAGKVLGDETPDTPWLAWGRDVEGAIAKAYAHETGREVIDLGATEFQHHPSVPWIAATLDRVTQKIDGDAWVPLELKAVSAYQVRNADTWAEMPPLQYEIQLQMQMACTGAAWGVLCGLIGGTTLVHVEQDRNDRFISSAMPVLEEFWDRVQRKDPPAPDSLPGTMDVVKRLWSQEDGETVPMDVAALDLVEQWEKAKSRRNAQDKRAKELETKLRAYMKNATFGSLPDGTFLSLKTTKRKGYTVGPKEFRTLRRFTPKR